MSWASDILDIYFRSVLQKIYSSRTCNRTILHCDQTSIENALAMFVTNDVDGLAPILDHTTKAAVV